MEMKSLTLDEKTYDSFPDKTAVKSINGNKPDENGNVVVAVSGGGTGADYGYLKGLKYYALGDSIASMQGTLASPVTFGSVGYTKDLQNRAIGDITVEGYVTAIERRYGLVATNRGAAGHTLVVDYSTLAALDYSDVALVTIAYGVNDARTGVPLGTVNSTDVYTFAGALNNLLRKIYTDNPECRVLVLSPLQRLTITEFGIATPNANGNYLIDFVNMCKAVAEKRSTAFLDQYRCTGINQTNLYYYTVEGVHPVNQGFARIKNAVIGILDELFELEYEPIGVMTNTGDTEPEEPDVGGDTGGEGEPPEEEAQPTEVDITDQFTVEGVDMDGYGTGKNVRECQTARYKPIAGKTYTIITYAPVGTTDYRGYCTSYGRFAEDGHVGGGYIGTGSAGLTAGAVSVTSEGNVTIDGTEAQKLKCTFTAAKTMDESKWMNIGCLDTCVPYVKVSYI